MQNADLVSFSIINQYVKRSSIECPNSPQSFNLGAPKVSVSVEIGVSPLSQDYYESSLVVTYDASSINSNLTDNLDDDISKENVICFVGKVVYAAIVKIIKDDSDSLSSDGIDELVKYKLMVEIPNLLFPFVRQSIFVMTSSCGFPPLLLDNINFKQMYLNNINLEQDKDDEE